MKFRFIKIITILISFFFLTGFLPVFSILGPSVTAIASGNIYKAGAQYMINKTIEDTTGKNSLTFVKDKIEESNEKKNLNAKAEKGSLLSIIGLVVIKAEDHNNINISGNILTISGFIDH